MGLLWAIYLSSIQLWNSFLLRECDKSASQLLAARRGVCVSDARVGAKGQCPKSSPLCFEAIRRKCQRSAVGGGGTLDLYLSLLAKCFSSSANAWVVTGAEWSSISPGSSYLLAQYGRPSLSPHLLRNETHMHTAALLCLKLVECVVCLGLKLKGNPIPACFTGTKEPSSATRFWRILGFMEGINLARSAFHKQRVHSKGSVDFPKRWSTETAGWRRSQHLSHCTHGHAEPLEMRLCVLLATRPLLTNEMITMATVAYDTSFFRVNQGSVNQHSTDRISRCLAKYVQVVFYLKIKEMNSNVQSIEYKAFFNGHWWKWLSRDLANIFDIRSDHYS